MFKSTIRTLSGTLLILAICNMSMSYAQIGLGDRQEMESKARTSLLQGNYNEALSVFRKLMEVEPADPLHPYHAGICLVELNRDLADAIEYLVGASNSGIPGVPTDVNYYLGLAYYRSYNFRDAETYFRRFELEADRQEIKAHKLDHLLASLTSAREITASYNPFEVLNVTFIDLRDSSQFSQVKMKGGRLQRKPAAYYGPDEDPEGLTSLAFVPRNAVKGDYIYYAGYGRNQKDGAQLYRVKKGSSNTWGNPEEIKSLNSQGDDILPYFDPIENDLYFASNGRLGVGGFDLYRSHYDSERDKWSEPLNLGFPVNSAMDEYLLLPGSDLGMVIFFSNRQGTDSSVAVYRVHLAEPQKETVANDSQMLREIAQLGEVAEDILAELEKMDQSGPAAPSGMLSSRNSPTETQKEPPSHPTPVTVVSESKGQARYRHILSQAMKHESASDSLTSLANQTRDQARDSEDPNDRWVWQKQIMLWEKKARDETAIADALYAKLDRERTANQARVSRLVPAAIEVDTVMGDLTVYRYKPSHAPPAESKTKAPAAPGVVLASSPPASVPKANAKPIPDGIDILGESPYSTQNPIPMDVPLPPGVFYRVQMGSFAAEVDPDAFGGISPISGVRSSGGGRVRYFAGKFRNYADASEALSMIRNIGYTDAFIVAWYNGNIVSTQEAKALE